MDENKIRLFSEYLKESGSAVFFGGAGVSTESGVKDFRSTDGLYNTVKDYGISPEEILSHHFLFENPDIFYDFYYRFFLSETAKPNPAHLALAKLEQDGRLQGVITQNIDDLHQQAGSRNVMELHGTARTFYCSRCLKPFPVEQVEALKGKVPLCPHCGGLIRPKVTLYEEALDETVVEKAIRALSDADLLIVGGTSLAVYPAAAYLQYFRGNHIVLINRDETPLDTRADLIFREPIGQVMTALLKEL